ncbi:MAG: ferrous iron transporter B [Melioribacteraceae bacterium]|nr:MAG: ferrous iron transporter B [Melioribacteraceae bacterium]
MKNSLQTDKKLNTITLIGPPNSGKTTLFNFLSGQNARTVNYPGSTVEYATTPLKTKYGIDAELVDSPGIISLMPGSPDEEVTINALFDHPRYGQPELVIVTADAGQLTRHLIITSQLIEAGFDIVLVLTMPDLLAKKGYRILSNELAIKMGCEVVIVDGRNGDGIDYLVETVKNKFERLQPDSGKKILNREQVSRKDQDGLLADYKRVESIVAGTIVSLEKIPDKRNLDKANKQLTVLDHSGGLNKIDASTINIDKYMLHPVFGILAFFIIMTGIFTSVFWLAIPFMDAIDGFFSALAGLAVETLGATWYGDFVADGMISGTGSVLVFLPQIAILFFILGLLEDSGYLARGAMLVDKPLSRIGLNGRSFVPMLSGFACAIPAMMAARTISNRRERLLTIFILPLMSCSARLPVYALLLAFLVPADKVWLGGIALAGIYIFGIFGSVIISAIANKFNNKLFGENDDSSFILELPSYRIPKLSVVLNNTWTSSYSYIKKAGPIILVFSIALWFLSYFPNPNPQIDTAGKSAEEVEEAIQIERLETSYLSDLGTLIQPAMTPIGMDWRVGVSLISAFAAREVFVSSLALIFKVTGEEDEIQDQLLGEMRRAEVGNTGQKLFTPATILGLIVFFVFALQCLTTVAVSRKETGGWRIPILQLILFTFIAYGATFLTVNGLRAIGIS